MAYSVSTITSPSFPASGCLPFDQLCAFYSDRVAKLSGGHTYIAYTYTLSVLCHSTVGSELHSGGVFSTSFDSDYGKSSYTYEDP